MGHSLIAQGNSCCTIWTHLELLRKTRCTIARCYAKELDSLHGLFRLSYSLDIVMRRSNNVVQKFAGNRLPSFLRAVYFCSFIMGTRSRASVFMYVFLTLTLGSFWLSKHYVSHQMEFSLQLVSFLCLATQDRLSKDRVNELPNANKTIRVTGHDLNRRYRMLK